MRVSCLLRSAHDLYASWEWLSQLSQAGHRARALAPRQAAGQRRARTHAPHAQTAGRTAAAGNEAAQQRFLNRFRRSYNEERPHHSLNLKTPASLYTRSNCPYPEDLPDPDYPGHFEPRRVTKIGVFTWKQHQIFLTEALRGETLG
ncbi:MAG TPA: integrase core domain-containing protein, partial [Longimicrobiales bacterium]|nr:integrase core domain-containing protein [Longimicrobiales bacterium]